MGAASGRPSRCPGARTRLRRRGRRRRRCCPCVRVCVRVCACVLCAGVCVLACVCGVYVLSALHCDAAVCLWAEVCGNAAQRSGGGGDLPHMPFGTPMCLCMRVFTPSPAFHRRAAVIPFCLLTLLSPQCVCVCVCLCVSVCVGVCLPLPHRTSLNVHSTHPHGAFTALCRPLTHCPPPTAHRPLPTAPGSHGFFPFSVASAAVEDDVVEWEEALDEASGKPYWVNRQRGESTWQRPKSGNGTSGA